MRFAKWIVVIATGLALMLGSGAQAEAATHKVKPRSVVMKGSHKLPNSKRVTVNRHKVTLLYRPQWERVPSGLAKALRDPHVKSSMKRDWRACWVNFGGTTYIACPDGHVETS